MREYSGGSRPPDNGGPGHPDPGMRRGRFKKKYIFRPFGPQFGLEIRRGSGPPGPSPGSAICQMSSTELENLIIDSHLFITFLSFFNLLRSYCHLENFWRCIIVIFHHPDFIYILRIDWRLLWKSSRQELTLSLSWESFGQKDFPFFLWGIKNQKVV